MIWKLLQNQDLQQRYYDWIVKIMNYQGKMQILPVDFEQPWWTILWIQKGRIVAIFIAQVIWTLQWVLLPIFIAWAIESRNYGYLLGIILVRVVSVYLVTWIFYQNAILQLQAMQGIYVNAITTLLQVDPIHHATKSTGQIIAKVERGSDAFEDILDIITFEVLNIGIGLISV